MLYAPKHLVGLSQAEQPQFVGFRRTRLLQWYFNSSSMCKPEKKTLILFPRGTLIKFKIVRIIF